MTQGGLVEATFILVSLELHCEQSLSRSCFLCVWFSLLTLVWSNLNRGVPPGARFDPYGPPGVPGFEPNRFVRYVINSFLVRMYACVCV